MLNKLIGIPFVDSGRELEGADCWGLCMLYYKEILGIEINDFKGSAYESTKVFAEYKKQIEANWQAVSCPRIHCIVAMCNNSVHPTMATHFGIYIGGGKILHTLIGIGSHITRSAHSIKGYYEWQH